MDENEDLDTSAPEQAPENTDDGLTAAANLLGASLDDDGNTAPVVEGDDNPEVDAPEKEDPPEDDSIEVVVDGRPVKMTKAEIAEAYKGQLRQADYTKKTTAASEQVKAAETKAAQERQQYVQNLQGLQLQLQTAVQTGQLKAPDPSLIEENPQEYLRQQAKWTAAQNAWQDSTARLNHVYEQHKQELHQQSVQHLQSQSDQLLAKIPEWKNEDKYKAESDEIKAYMRKQGYSDEEIGRVADARTVVLMRDAMLLSKSREQASKVKDKLAKAPVRPVIKAGARQEPNGPQVNKSAVQSLRRTGSVDDAARVFRSLM